MFCNREEHTVKGNFYTKLQTHTNYLIHDSNSTSELWKINGILSGMLGIWEHRL